MVIRTLRFTFYPTLICLFTLSARINTAFLLNTTSLPSYPHHSKSTLRSFYFQSTVKSFPFSIRPFVTCSVHRKAQEAYDMEDFSFDDSFEQNVDNESDAFSPEKPKKTAAKKSTTAKPAAAKKTTSAAPKKAAAPKKPAAPKSDKPKAPAKPRAKKAKEPEPLDEGVSMGIDDSFSILETPQTSSEMPSPPRPTILQENNAGGVSKKNASETYQKLTQLEHVLVRPDTVSSSPELN